MNVFIINYQQYNMLGTRNECVYNQLSTVEHAGVSNECVYNQLSTVEHAGYKQWMYL